jgi:D-ribitol-5-phosphate cytidylyltransferase
MPYALIFAGGTGSRMHSKSVPKQFLLVHGKPIIIHTILKFEENNNIDGIVVVCLKDWIDKLNILIKKYNIKKVVGVVPGGNTGQESIFNGLRYLITVGDKEDIVLIHDGVRPLVSQNIINQNIEVAKEKGNAITVVKAIETIAINKNGYLDICNREDAYICRAPQTFILKDIYECHLKARKAGINNMTDSATLMQKFGKIKINIVIGDIENIKITTTRDFFLFKALLDAKELGQVVVL